MAAAESLGVGKTGHSINRHNGGKNKKRIRVRARGGQDKHAHLEKEAEVGKVVEVSCEKLSVQERGKERCEKVETVHHATSYWKEVIGHKTELFGIPNAEDRVHRMISYSYSDDDSNNFFFVTDELFEPP